MGSFPVISTPFLRHEHVPEVCRIHPASPRLMTRSRLHLSGPTRCYCRISIDLLAAQHVKRGFGQMARYRAHRLGVAFPCAQARVELADMPLRAASVIHRHRIRRFRKRPFQPYRVRSPLECTRGVVPL